MFYNPLSRVDKDQRSFFTREKPASVPGGSGAGLVNFSALATFESNESAWRAIAYFLCAQATGFQFVGAQRGAVAGHSVAPATSPRVAHPVGNTGITFQDTNHV